MARRFVDLVFDDVIMGTSEYYTADHHEVLLGSVSRLALQVVVDKTTGTSPRFSLQAQQTLDGRSWKTVDPSERPEIDQISVTPPGPFNFSTSVSHANPRFSRVRFRLFLGGTNPTARVKVYATGHDRA